MKELLKEYKKTLKQTRNQIRDLENDAAFKYADPQALYEFLKAAQTDLQFAIAWIEKGYQPDAHYRGVQRNDAYYVMRPYDPSIIERYIENDQARGAYEFIEESYENVEEMQEQKRIEFEESLSKEKLCAIHKAKRILDDFEMQVVLLSEQGRSVREIAEMLGVSHMKIQRTKKTCRKKFEGILKETEFKSVTNKKHTFICHCELRANDGKAHITAKPTISVEALDKQEAGLCAVIQLEQQYRALGCKWVDVSVVLINES